MKQMNLIILGDREELHREGVQHFLLTLYDGLRYTEAPAFRDWRQHLHAAAVALAQQGAVLDEVTRTLLRALRELLEDREAAMQRYATLAQNLEYARSDVERCQARWKSLYAATSTTQLHALQARVEALKQELAQAHTAQWRLEMQIAELQQKLAARETTIAELNRLIARQVEEFNDLFGTVENLDGAA